MTRKRRSSLAIPRIGEPGTLRVLRVRGDRDLVDMVRKPPGESGGGAFEVPSREGVVPGERVNVEVSFGPHADEILCAGVVRRVRAREGGKAPIVEIQVVRTHAHRTEYVLQVLRGEREATARAHRRVATEFKGRWWWGIKPHTVSIDQLSKGGTFVHSASAPKVGFRFPLEIRTSAALVPLRLESHVVWVSRDIERPGFGAAFKVDDRSVSTRLLDILSDAERYAPALA